MNNKRISVLSIEDNPADATIIEEILAEASRLGWNMPHFRIEHADCLEAGLSRLDEGDIDVVLSDLDLPDSPAGETFATIHAHAPNTPIVVLTGREDDDLARQTVRAGAEDYLFKQEMSGSLLAHSLIYAIQRQENKCALQEAHDKLEQQVEERTEELRQANATLREREQRLQILFEEAPVGMTETDLDGSWIRVNQRFCEIVGYTREELSEMTYRDITHPDDLEANDILTRRVLDEELSSFRLEKRYIRKDGAIIWVNLMTTLERDPTDAPDYFIAVIQDITERKQTEKELKRLSTAVQMSPDSIFITDMEGQITHANQAMARLHGLGGEEDAIGTHISNWFTPPDRVQSAMQEILEKGNINSRECNLLTKDGRRVPVEISATVLREGQNEPTGFVAIAREITARKQAEEKLEQRLEQVIALSRASRAVTTFLQLDQVLKEIIVLADDVLNSDYTGLVLMDEAGQIDRSFGNLSELPSLEYRAREDGFTNWIAHSRQPIIVDEINEDGLVDLDINSGMPQKANPYLVEAGIKSLAGLPLIAKERLLGVLYLHSTQPDTFQGKETVLQGFANQVAIAIENARLFGEARREIIRRKWTERALRRYALQLETLRDVALKITTHLDLDDLLQEIVKRGCHLLDVPSGSLYLVDEARGDLEQVVSYGYKRDRTGSRLAPGEGASGKVMQSGESLVVDNYSTWEGQSPQWKDEHYTGILVIPLKHGDQVIGTLSLDEIDQPRHFDDDDVELAEAFAAQATIAIHNAQLYEQAQHEIEKRVKAEEALARSNAELEQFAYTISHDLQAPLRTMTGFLNLLKQRADDSLDDQLNEYIDYTTDGAERMQEMIEALLDLSRVGTRGEEFAPTDVEAVLERTLKALRQTIQENKAKVTYDSLPTVMADKAQLGQVFQNLIANAIKFHREDKAPQVHISATSSPETERGKWLFSVTDNGIGIDPEQAEYIFQVFQRLHTEEEYPGLGIGLALCKRIVERHGGRIWVESAPNEGSTFYFTLEKRKRAAMESRST